jgi:hypothetical protein
VAFFKLAIKIANRGIRSESLNESLCRIDCSYPIANEVWSYWRMEFRRFLHLIVLLPAQIVHSGRRIIYRIMGYNERELYVVPSVEFCLGEE